MDYELTAAITVQQTSGTAKLEVWFLSVLLSLYKLLRLSPDTGWLAWSFCMASGRQPFFSTLGNVNNCFWGRVSALLRCVFTKQLAVVLLVVAQKCSIPCTLTTCVRFQIWSSLLTLGTVIAWNSDTFLTQACHDGAHKIIWGPVVLQSSCCSCSWRACKLT